jgi:hypothetical protein
MFLKRSAYRHGLYAPYEGCLRKQTAYHHGYTRRTKQGCIRKQGTAYDHGYTRRTKNVFGLCAPPKNVIRNKEDRV